MSNSIVARNNVNVISQNERVMVLAHSFGCDQNMWRYVTTALKDDHRLVLFDYVGAGKSDISAFEKDRYGHLEGYTKDVIEVIESVG